MRLGGGGADQEALEDWLTRWSPPGLGVGGAVVTISAASHCRLRDSQGWERFLIPGPASSSPTSWKTWVSTGFQQRVEDQHGRRTSHPRPVPGVSEPCRKEKTNGLAVGAWAITPETQPDSGQEPSRGQHPCGSEQRKRPPRAGEILVEVGPLSWAALAEAGPGLERLGCGVNALSRKGPGWPEGSLEVTEERVPSGNCV